MKKALLFLIIGVTAISTQVANTFAIEFEIIRTPETPGFFLLKIFPSKDLAPIKKENIFIKNFKKSQEKKYENVIEIIEDLGHKVIEKDALNTNKANTNIFVLGKQIKDYQTLTIKNDPVKSFEDFQKEHMQKIFFEDLQILTGGNISDIYIENEAVTENQSVNIIGKFNRPQKTRIEIQGRTNQGENSFSSNLPLDEKARSNDPLSSYLPELWEKAHLEKNPEKNTISFLHIFPIILFLSGLFFISIVLIGLRNQKKTKKTKSKKAVPKNIQKSSEGIPNGLPFEIEFNTKPKKK